MSDYYIELELSEEEYRALERAGRRKARAGLEHLERIGWPVSAELSASDEVTADEYLRYLVITEIEKEEHRG